MKNVSFLFIFTIILFVFNMNVSSQTWTPGTNKMFINPWNTNVGVGTSNPQTRLHVYGSTGQNSFRVDVAGSQRFLVASNGGTSIGGSVTPPKDGLYVAGKVGIGTSGTVNANLQIHQNTNPYFEISNSISRLQIAVASQNWAFANGSVAGDVVFRPLGNRHSMIFYMPNTNNDGNSYIKFGDAHNSLWMGIFNNRTVRIDGTVYAREIRVQTNVWADYVFDSDYELKPLTEVEQFIKENKHLPNVPKQEIVIEEGINVGDMNVIMMQKIEELTLYIIELNKKVEVLEQTAKK